MQENRFWCSACHINCLFWRFFRKVVSFSCSTKPVCMHLERLYNSNRTSKFRSAFLCMLLLGMLIIWRGKEKDISETDERNFDYSVKGTYGTAGYMKPEEQKKF